MEDNRKSFVFYAEWTEAIQDFPAETIAEIFLAVSNYATQGIEPEGLSPVAKMAFKLMRQQIDRDRQRFEDIRQKRREAGRQGGAPKGNNNAAAQTGGQDADNQEKDQNNQNKQPEAETSKNKQNKQMVDLVVSEQAETSKNKQPEAKSNKTSLYVYEYDILKEKLALKENPTPGAAEASLLPEVSGKACEASRAEATDVSDSGHKGGKSERIDYAGFLACWNKTMAGTNVPAMKSFTDTRRRALRARIGTYGKETVLAVMRKIPASDFLAGRAKEFRATFDWAFTPTNFQKILEGNYDNEAATRASPGESLAVQRRDAEAKARIAAQTEERERAWEDARRRSVSREEYQQLVEQHRRAGDLEQWQEAVLAEGKARSG